MKKINIILITLLCIGIGLSMIGLQYERSNAFTYSDTITTKGRYSVFTKTDSISYDSGATIVLTTSIKKIK